MVGRERARGSPKRVLVEEGEELVGGRAQGVRGGDCQCSFKDAMVEGWC